MHAYTLHIGWTSTSLCRRRRRGRPTHTQHATKKPQAIHCLLVHAIHNWYCICNKQQIDVKQPNDYIHIDLRGLEYFHTQTHLRSHGTFWRVVWILAKIARKYIHYHEFKSHNTNRWCSPVRTKKTSYRLNIYSNTCLSKFSCSSSARMYLTLNEFRK